jgi:ABC-type multidrug transport system fused ATPase/permease subunit
MKAEKFFADKHCASLENSLRARLRQQITVGTLNVLNQLPTFVIQLLFLGIGLLLALDQTGGSSVGNIVTILALSTLIMAPINALSRCMVMVSQSWPSIETILGLLERKGRIDQSASRSPDQEQASRNRHWKPAECASPTVLDCLRFSIICPFGFRRESAQR